MKAAWIRKFDRTSFRSKLVLTYVVIIVVPVVLALFVYGLQLYKQTQVYYEDILGELSKRTNVIMNDFFINLTRNSFFYLTDSKLHNIIEKSHQQDNRQYIEDANNIQRAMDQFILMNGNISTISVLAPNGRTYTSQSDKGSNIVDLVDEIGRERLKNSNFVVHVPDNEDSSGSKKQVISIVRYMSDLYSSKHREGYVKVDVNFKTVGSMLGDIRDENLKLGTLVLAGDRVIYHSGQLLNKIPPDELPAFAELSSENISLSQLNLGKESYLVSGKINPATGWKVIHFIPVNQIIQTFIQNTLNYVLLCALALMMAFLLAYFFNRYFMKPILQLGRAMRFIDAGNLVQIEAGLEREDEIGRLFRSYNAMIDRLKSSRDSEIMSSRLQKRAELKMLQTQINPHFLYNTLNVIHSISELNRMDDISTMTRSLSSMYRYNIKYGDEVTIDKELEQMANYINIQQIRFLNKFRVEYRIDPAVRSCKILKFLIQPIVENSFYHGLEPKGGQGMLMLTIVQQGNKLYIRIEDDGIGISPEKIGELTEMFQKADHLVSNDSLERNFGLSNVYMRIKHFYGDGYWMKVSCREPSGTCIELSIPIKKEADRDENSGGR